MPGERAGRLRALPLTAFRLSADELAAGNERAKRLGITRNELARRAYLAEVGAMACPPPGDSGLTPRESRELETVYEE